MLPPGYHLSNTDWHQAELELSDLRQRVFMIEQGVSAEDEWDGLDADAVHFLVRSTTGEAVATGRIVREAEAWHLGRLAVLKAHRRQGLGRALIRAMLAWCQHQTPPEQPIYLNAQITALAFYRALGFTPQGPVFMDAGILHRRMDYSAATTPQAGDYYRFEGQQQLLLEALALCQGARRRILVAGPELALGVYDQYLLTQALSALARGQRAAELRILIYNLPPLLERGHSLLRLAQRLPSKVALRVAHPDTEHAGQHLLLIDQDQGLLLNADTHYSGHVYHQQAGRLRALHEVFEREWQQAEPDPQLRQLHL